MVEKTGHKTTMRNARMQWIDEGKPRTAAAEDEEEDYRIHQGSSSGPQQADRVAPIFEQAAQAALERARTPTADNLFGDDDIYNATPRRDAGNTAPARQAANDDVPDGDDLDALMAEAEAESAQPSRPAPAPSASIFGNGSRTTAPAPAGQPDDDDLDALMAEAEADSAPSTRPSQAAVTGSIFGNGVSKSGTTQGDDEDGDDLDALMAEAEAHADAVQPDTSSNQKLASPAGTSAGQQSAGFEDEEEAMAEMDGLW